MSDPLLRLDAVSRRYGARDVLHDVTLHAAAGEVLGLIGPNGGGKSTTLLMLAGLVRPTTGTVTVDGLPAHALATSRAGAVGLITADHGLYPLLTGRENLAFFGGLFGLTPSQVADRAGPLVQELELEPHLDNRAGSYSSGMKQKLSLVRARLLEPKALLLDEPTANLDPLSADTIHRVVRREADRGLAVVLVTHDLTSARAVCDRVAVIDGTVRHVHTLEGPRHAPAPSPLLELYRTHTERR